MVVSYSGLTVGVVLVVLAFVGFMEGRMVLQWFAMICLDRRKVT